MEQRGAASKDIADSPESAASLKNGTSKFPSAFVFLCSALNSVATLKISPWS
jgi:hypothetical protein